MLRFICHLFVFYLHLFLFIYFFSFYILYYVDEKKFFLVLKAVYFIFILMVFISNLVRFILVLIFFIKQKTYQFLCFSNKIRTLGHSNFSYFPLVSSPNFIIILLLFRILVLDFCAHIFLVIAYNSNLSFTSSYFPHLVFFLLDLVLIMLQYIFQEFSQSL